MSDAVGNGNGNGQRGSPEGEGLNPRNETFRSRSTERLRHPSLLFFLNAERPSTRTSRQLQSHETLEDGDALPAITAAEEIEVIEQVIQFVDL